MAIDTTMVRSRRSLLTATLAAVAGAAAATVAGAQRVLAAGDDGRPMLVAGNYFDARNTTQIANQFDDKTVFEASSSFGGTAVHAHSGTGFGLAANSDSGEAVFGQSTTGTGVHGVVGPVSPAYGYPSAVLGEAKLPAGLAMLGNNYAKSGHAVGVQGTSDSPTGLATIGWARRSGTGLIGVAGSTFPSVPAKTGVYGNAPAGRGMVAAGGKAQLRLMPSTATTHPASGALGDIFLDKNKRLWFCKGATVWKQIV